MISPIPPDQLVSFTYVMQEESERGQAREANEAKPSIWVDW
jgi:hypothetical protein